MNKRKGIFLIICFLYVFVIPVLSQDINQLMKTGDSVKIKALLEKNPELVNEKDNREWTPLHYASFHGHNEVVELLINRGAEIESVDNIGCTALHRAALRGHMKIAKLLVETGADINKKKALGEFSLFYAVGSNRKKLTENLISQGADVNIKEGDGQAPLHLAAALGHREIAERLITNGADKNVKRRYDITPLHYAAAGGHKSVVELFIEKGANLNIKSRNGATPTHFADLCGHMEIVDLLVSGGVNTDPRDFPVLRGDYLGMKKPGLTPEPFAPGILWAVFNPHSNLTISPDGKEIYWTDSYFSNFSKIWFMKLENNQWTAPEIAPFSRQYHHEGPFFSPDGSRLYFCSNRPIIKNGAIKKDLDIWYVEREKEGWGEPKNIGLPVNTDNTEEWVSVSKDGTLYFNLYYRDGTHTGADIYQSRLINGQYNNPEKVKIINTDYYEGCPYIAPDESYIIFCSNRPGGYYTYTELYISFRKKDGSWTQGFNMGKTINMGNITCPGMSPDHRYLFFTHRTNGIADFYWVDAKIIDELKPKGKKEF